MQWLHNLAVITATSCWCSAPQPPSGCEQGILCSCHIIAGFPQSARVICFSCISRLFCSFFDASNRPRPFAALEWHEAVGAASAILTFVAFSYDAIKVFREVTDKGSTAENGRSALLAEDSKAILDSLKVFADADHTGHAAQISKLAGECHDDGKRLVELLDKLKILPDGNGSSSPPRKTIRTKIHETANRAAVAAKSIFHRSEINALEERLSKTSSAIVLRLTALLNERQLATSLKLESIRSETRQQSQVLSKQMTSLEDALSKLSVCQPTTAPASGPPEASTVVSKTAKMDPILPSLADFKRLSDQIGELLRASSGPSPEIRILKQLYFPSMYHREDHMKSAEDGTFEWLLTDQTDNINSPLDDSQDTAANLKRHREGKERENSRTRLLNWLRNGHGVFHISGKAGAGKSTLMKMLVHHERVKAELELWAAGKTLVFGHFFFWRSGGKMQNSLEGLYRSLLFETLSKSPELLRHVFPEAYHKFSHTTRDECIEDLFFRQNKLQAAAQTLAGLSLPDGCRICLFIDGLDEYGEDGRDKQQHEDLARLLSHWGSNDRVKLLVSSRPEKEFNMAFSDPDQRITLHTLTRRDILLYADQSLRRHRSYDRIATDAFRLTEQIAARAEGIFVWAKFAVDTICRALRDDLYDIEKLLIELETLPDEMNEIYTRILRNKTSPGERKRACWLLQAVCNAGAYKMAIHPLFVLQIDDWHNPDFPFSFRRQEWSRAKAKQKLDEAVSRVNGLSGGLVEPSCNDINTSFDGAYIVELQPFHQSLRDFVFGNSEFAALVAETEKTYTQRFFFRIAFTNVWFSCIDAFRQMNDKLCTALEEEVSLPQDILFGAFDHDWVVQLFETKLIAGSDGSSLCEHLNWSFPHFAVSVWNTVPAPRINAWAKSESENGNEKSLSLLVSAALGRMGNAHPETLKQLLDQLDPNRLYSLTHFSRMCIDDLCCTRDLEITVWEAVCLAWIRWGSTHADIQSYDNERRFAVGRMLCDFLEAGADCNFFTIHKIGLPFGKDPAKLSAIPAPDILQVLAAQLDQHSNREPRRWEEKIAKLVEGTELTMPQSDEWANHGIVLADEQSGHSTLQQLAIPYVPIIYGLARGVRESEDDSVFLEVIWTEDRYHHRLH